MACEQPIEKDCSVNDPDGGFFECESGDAADPGCETAEGQERPCGNAVAEPRDSQAADRGGKPENRKHHSPCGGAALHIFGDVAG